MWYVICRRGGEIISETPSPSQVTGQSVCDTLNSINAQDAGNSLWYTTEERNDPSPPSIWRKIAAFFGIRST